jgi:hypothetical protein
METKFSRTKNHENKPTLQNLFHHLRADVRFIQLRAGGDN